jgi:hypothetical protein
MRVRRALVAVLLLAAVELGQEVTALASTRPSADLGADGIGAVRFGLTKARAVDELSARFGTPTWRGVNTGCGPRWTEVEWNDLAAEFRLDKFSGYRYASANDLHNDLGSPRKPTKHGVPRLATAGGLSLGSTLAQVRSAYPLLRFAGTDRHKTPDGIVFVDHAEHSPAPLSSRIIEIKTFGTCGDF